MSTNIDSLYTVRPYNQESDLPFIKATWLRGLYYGDSWFSKIPKDIFMNYYSPALDALISHVNVIITIACQVEDPDVILGYCATSSDYQIIHFVYVKAPWRKKGIARRISPNNPVSVSHMTK